METTTVLDRKGYCTNQCSQGRKLSFLQANIAQLLAFGVPVPQCELCLVSQHRYKTYGHCL